MIALHVRNVKNDRCCRRRRRHHHYLVHIMAPTLFFFYVYAEHSICAHVTILFVSFD